jgi:hypothetical protein
LNGAAQQREPPPPKAPQRYIIIFSLPIILGAWIAEWVWMVNADVSDHVGAMLSKTGKQILERATSAIVWHVLRVCPWFVVVKRLIVRYATTAGTALMGFAVHIVRTTMATPVAQWSVVGTKIALWNTLLSSAMLANARSVTTVFLDIFVVLFAAKTTVKT